MTTYTLNGLYTEFDNNENLTALQPSTIAVVLAPGSSTFSYTVEPVDADGIAEIDEPSGNIYTVLIDGSPLNLNGTEASVIEFDWGMGNTSTVLSIEQGNGEVLTFLGGDPLPNFTSFAQFETFSNSITRFESPTSGPFAPGADINLATLPGVTISENDFILGTDDDDVLLGGPGDDTIASFDGDDFINPGDNTNFDNVRPGTGNDTVDFADADVGYFEVYHSDLDTGITATLNTDTNTGTIDAGANGTNTFLNIRNAVQADGLYVGGTAQNDVFNVTLGDAADFQFLNVEGRRGNDTYNLDVGSNATLRIDFDQNDNTAGVVIDLGTGIVSNDGFGGQDTINGNATEIRGTALNDSILGSDADFESFILRPGNDTLDGAGGTDRVRYDRSGVEAVTVDLDAGTATGRWGNQTFTHSLSNIEQVRGSRDGNDSILGDEGDNRLDGRGGDDTLRGGDGRDRLEGGEGNDLLDASGGSAETQGFGDYVRPGLGNDVVIGHAGLFAQGDGIDISYANITGIGGVTITVGADGTGTAVSGDGRSNDTFTFTHYFEGTQEGDLITGSDADRFEGFAGLGGNDTIDGGGGGEDRVDYSYEADYFGGNGSGIVANLTTGIVTDTQGGTDLLRNIEQIEGSDFADIISAVGKAENVRLSGNGGDDTLSGGAGNDYIEDDAGTNLLFGNNGDDDLAVHEGNNTVNGGAGFDTAEIYDDTSGAVVINYQAGPNGDQLRIEGRSDTGNAATVTYTTELVDIERVATGVDGNLLILGDDGNNRIKLNTGPDRIDFEGGAGTDRLELHRFINDDGSRGVTRAEFDAEIGLDLGGTGNTSFVRLFDREDGSTFGTLRDVEEIRLNDGVFTLDELAGITGGGGGDEPSVINGTPGNDPLPGTADDDLINGLAGNDTLEGLAGNDTLNGGADDDVLRDGDGDDLVNGGDGNDLWEMGSGQDTFDGGAGTDTVLIDLATFGLDPALVIESDLRVGGDSGVRGDTNARDTFIGVENYTLINGTNAAEVQGTIFDNVLVTAAGDDTLLGDNGFDTLRSGEGDDSVEGGNGRDLAFMGAGNDLYRDNTQDGELGRDTVFAEQGNDTIEGGAGDDEFHGQQGDDSIFARNGDDLIFGGIGFDTVFAGNGNDRVFGGDGRDLVFMGDGADEFFDNGQGSDLGRDTVFGEQGNDTVRGGNGNDEFHGQQGDDSLFGGDGDDRVFGGIGNDTVFGGRGFDTVFLGDGDDVVNAGDGRDFVIMGAGDDVFFDNGQGGELGRDTVFAELGNDTVFGGNGDDEFHGQAGDDQLFAALGNDLVFAGSGFDTVDGGEGNDTVFGGLGRDVIRLGNGDDRFVDSAQGDALGADTITGGAGADTFDFSAAPGADVITDFEVGIDTLGLTQSLWGGGLTEAQVVAQFGSVSGGAVVLDFMGGQSITLQGLTSTTGLEDDITFI